MKITLFILTLALTQVSFAKKNKSVCAQAEAVSGESCDNLIVKFDLRECGYLEEKQLPIQLRCKGKNAKASVIYDNTQYEAQFILEKKGWAGESWRRSGSISKTALQVTAKTPEPVVERQVAQSVAPAAPVEKKSDVQWKVSGYLDARITNIENHKSQSTSTGHSESGFGLEDGAIYINVDKEKYSLVIDMPFRRFKDADDNPGTGPYSNNQKILIGGDKAQLYGKMKLHEQLILSVGQFDTPYGVELNDSKDRFFNKTGLVYDATLPVTHTGLLAEIPLDIFTLKLMAANSNNKGTLGKSSSGDNSYEYGVTFGSSQEKWRFQLGAMTRPINKADGTDKGTRSLYDVTVGTTWGSFSADLEYAIVHDESKNTLTSGDNTDSEKDGTGALLLLSYQFKPEWSLGLRFEQLDQDPAASSTKTSNSSGVSVHYKPSSDYEVRSEYINYKFKMVNDSKWEQDRFNLGVLFFF